MYVARGQTLGRPQEHYLPTFKTRLSMAWSSLNRPGWLAMCPREPPVSASPVPGLQTYHAWHYGASSKDKTQVCVIARQVSSSNPKFKIIAFLKKLWARCGCAQL